MFKGVRDVKLLSVTIELEDLTKVTFSEKDIADLDLLLELAAKIKEFVRTS